MTAYREPEAASRADVEDLRARVDVLERRERGETWRAWIASAAAWVLVPALVVGAIVLASAWIHGCSAAEDAERARRCTVLCGAEGRHVAWWSEDDDGRPISHGPHARCVCAPRPGALDGGTLVIDTYREEAPR